MTNPKDRKFYEYLREERQFSFLLAHLVMQRGDALARFIELIHKRSPAGEVPNTAASLDDAEIYVEFAELRDQWDCLLQDEGSDPGAKARANVNKRKFVASKFRAVKSLQHLADDETQQTNADFNEFFMGDAGRRITGDVASPALWSVKSLKERFAATPEIFLDLCRLKWSFRIKPDLVIRIPGMPTLCIEAKLESGEGTYPSGNEEIRIVEDVCGAGTRVKQFELQHFLFDRMLGEPCLPIVVQKRPPLVQRDDRVVLTWHSVLARLADDEHLASSIPFVRRILRGNRALLSSRSEHAPD